MDTLIDVLSLDDTSDQDRLKDVSEEDINNAKLGKVCQSENSGQVEGDRNVGGIAGSMAIDYDLDPEDDIQTAGKTSLNFRYETLSLIHI